MIGKRIVFVVSIKVIKIKQNVLTAHSTFTEYYTESVNYISNRLMCLFIHFEAKKENLIVCKTPSCLFPAFFHFILFLMLIDFKI